MQPQAPFASCSMLCAFYKALLILISDFFFQVASKNMCIFKCQYKVHKLSLWDPTRERPTL